MNNIILMTDSYKASHYKQYPPGTTKVYSYIEARKGDFKKTTFFGLQMFLKKVLSKPIVKEDIDEAEAFFTVHGEPFNREGWEYILNEHGGYLPLRICAVPEGTNVELSNVLVTVENTDPKCFWLTSYMETGILRATWYGTTVATISKKAKEIIYQYLQMTCDDPDGQIAFKLHDFGGRGVSSGESAEIGGAAHLVNFMGSDTVEGIVAANRYYGVKSGMSAFSIPAAEHSTITVWGRNNEKKAYENMLDKFGGSGKMLAVVSDSYDIFNATENIWGKELKSKVMNMGGTLVVRPDSGDPKEVVLKVLESLGRRFGTIENNKGFKVLSPCVRVIQGDGCNLITINEVLNVLYENGWSAENVAFGMGGGLLQKLDRDTLYFAMKASYAEVNGEEVEVFKCPIGDTAKLSKRGRLALVKDVRGFFVTEKESLAIEKGWTNHLVPVFENGQILKTYTFDEVRDNSNK